MGQDDPVKPDQSLPVTVVPNAPRVTPGPHTVFHIDTTIAQAANRDNEPPMTAPPAKPRTTKKPPVQPSVTKVKEARVTSLKVTTTTAKSAAAPQPGISEMLL